MQRVDFVEQHSLEAFGHLPGIAVRAADRLAHDLVDQSQAVQALGGQAQLLGRILGLVGGLPQDRSAAFGRDHRVGAVFQHQRAIAHADSQRAAGAAFADHGTDDRHFQFGHFQQVAGDRLGLAALFGIDPGPGAGGVDKGQQWQLEALGQFHQAQRLAIALGARHAEVAPDLGLGVAALLMADDHDAAAVDAGQTTDDGLVVAKGAVAGQLLELVADHPQIIQRVRPRRMTRELRHLPRGQVAEDLRGAQAQFVLQRVHLGVDIDRRAVAGVTELLDLCFQIGDGLLEVEVVGIHARAVGLSGRQSS